MRTKCPSGMILRKGYTKKNRRVKASCIIAQSASGLKRSEINARILKKTRNNCIKRNKTYKKHNKCNILFHLEKGTLSKFGYTMKNSQRMRHISLKKAIKSIKPLSIYRRLNALYVLNKNKHPDNAKIFKNDAEWLKQMI
jgi:hypothetical protein